MPILKENTTEVAVLGVDTILQGMWKLIWTGRTYKESQINCPWQKYLKESQRNYSWRKIYKHVIKKLILPGHN